MAISRRRPTSADVAARAGVSRTTVSFVLNDRPGANISPPTRERVLLAAAELGYHPHAPARILAGGKSHTLGFVLRQSAEQVAGDAALAETLRGLAAAARSAGFRVMVEPLDPDGGSYEGLLRAQHVDGLVVSGPRVDDAGLARLARDGFPIVLQGSMPGLDVASVDIDNVSGARRAVEHLIGLGRRRIACITNAPLAYTAAQERRDGYRSALEAAGIAYDDDLVAEAAFDAGSGHRAMAELLAAAPDRRGVRRERRRRVRGDRRDPRGRTARPRRRVGRRLRRHRPRGVLRSAAHDRPPARLRPGPRGRHRAARPHRRPGPAGPDAPADRAHRPLVDGARRRRRCTGARSLISHIPSLGGQEEMGRGRSAVQGKETRMQQSTRHGVASPQSWGRRPSSFAACSSNGSSGSAKSVTVIGTWGGDEEKNFKAMVAPWEKETGNTVKYTGTRDINQILTTGVASGVLPDLAGLPGPGQMTQFAKAGALKPLDDVLDMAKLQGRDRAGARRARHGRRQDRRRVHQGRGQGPDLVQPQAPRLRGGAADDAGTTSTSQAAANKGSAEATWCIGARVRRRIRLARHRLDRGHRPALRPAPTVTTSGGTGNLKWTSPEIKTAFAGVRQGRRRRAYGGSNTVLTTNFEKGGDPLFKDPPGCEFHHQASFITGLGAFKAAKAGTDYNFFPFPDIDPAVHRRGRGRRRPVRHVPRHARGEVADEVPRHRASPGHLGQGRRRALGEQERRRAIRTTSRSGRPRC